MTKRIIEENATIFAKYFTITFKAFFSKKKMKPK